MHFLKALLRLRADKIEPCLGIEWFLGQQDKDLRALAQNTKS